MIKKKGVLVVGAGIAGCTIARKLAEKGIKVDLIEKRDHVGGNAFDYINNKGERIHKYGPHLLHGERDSLAIKFLSRFTEWVTYEHKVKALLPNNQTTPIPVNRTTLEDIYNIKLETEEKTKEFLNSIRQKDLVPQNTDELFISNVGEKIADILFRPYTKKMWGLDAKELEVSIGSRLPIRTSRDDRYFTDTFQALPKEGYTKMIENILSHKNIKLELNKEFNKSMEVNYEYCFLCLPIDLYFNYKFGKLPYRSIIFEDKVQANNNQITPVINFTDNSKYTRVTKWSLLPNSGRSDNSLSTLTYEMPCSLEENPGEYYYPVKTKNSNEMYRKYMKISKIKKNICFCGRAGLFKYIDMIPAVVMHMRLAEKYLERKVV